jgi:hypothetical protein
MRARYYSPEDGRFLTEDSWQGDYNNPMSLNHWNYVEDNSVNYVDPTGRIKESEAKNADQIRNELKANYGVDIQQDYGWNDYGYGSCWNPGAWSSINELLWTKEAINDVTMALEGRIKFMILFKNIPVKITRTLDSSGGRSMAPPPPLSSFLGDVNLIGSNFDELYLKHTIAHELGHVWDYRNNYKLSDGMKIKLKTWVCYPGYGADPDCHFDVKAGTELFVGNLDTPYANGQLPGSPLPFGVNKEGPWEDWAESFAEYVSDAYYKQFNSPTFNSVLGPIRRQYIYDQIHDWE